MSFPSHVEFELTDICQLACVMCPYAKMERPKGCMPFETLKRVVDEANGRIRTSYLHQIGEPLLHKEYDRLINYASEGGIRTSISSNAMTLEGEHVQRILNSKLNELVLCMDGTDKKTYESIRPKGDFERVRNNIRNFLIERKKAGHGPTVLVQLIRMKQNLHQEKDFVDEFKGLVEGIGELWLKEFSRFAGYIDDMSPGGISPRRFTCSKPHNSVTIQWNGDVSVCCRDYNGIAIMGNVNQSSLEDIWNGENYQKFREKFKEQNWHKLCENC